MFKWFVLCALFAVAMADCNKLARLKVKHQWDEAFGISEDRDDFGRDVWTIVFKAHPDYPAKFFTRVHGDNPYSPEFRAHSARVLSGLDIGISLLDNEPVLKANLAHLAAQHKSRKIPNEAYDGFQAAVMTEVAHHVGHCFDFAAWNSCLGLIMTGIEGA